MAKVKYVAEGFTSDAQKLLKEFADCECLEFESFNCLWKKYNFGLIFMGRPTERELREFVNEMYELTLNYFDSSELEFKVGAIYLLYALFINQNIVSPIYIRITPSKYDILLNILHIAKKKKIETLHYVMDYLLDNCLEYVAFPSRFGPLTKKDYNKPNVQDEMYLSDINQDLVTLRESNILDEIKDLYIQDQNLKESCDSQREKLCHDKIKNIDSFKNRLECLINVKESAEPEPGTSAIKIGSNRKNLKEMQFKRKVIGKHGNYNEDSVEETVDEPSPSKSKIVSKRKVRKPPQERRIGRPKKFSEISPKKISESSAKPVNFKFVPSVVRPKQGRIGRKKVSYLEPYDMEVKLVADGEVSNVEEFSEENCNDDGYENDNSDIDNELTF